MNLDRSINRIEWRYSSGKSFKPNKNDVEAINSILSWINREKENKASKHTLFAKLYIFYLTDFARSYKTDYLDPFAQKRLSSLLDRPLAHFIDALERELYCNQVENILKKYTPDTIHNCTNTEQFKEKYNRGFLEAKIIHMVTEALNRFS